MQTNWLTFPIYLDEQLRFPACVLADLAVLEILERMTFVHDAIEYCFAEGRLMDREIFYQLEDLTEALRGQEEVSNAEIFDLASKMARRYGFDPEALSKSEWIRTEQDGRYCISIDQKRIIDESNARIFGR